MANRHWVGGSNTWNATAGTKWSTTAGGAGGAAVPTSSDAVFLDSSSGAVTVTIGATVNCLSLTCTGFTGTLTGSSAMNIGGGSTGDFLLVSGMTYTYTGTINFISSVGGNKITTAGKTLGSVFFNGPGSLPGWILQDNLTLGSGNTLRIAQSNSFSANNKNITAPGGVEAYISDSATLDMGSGTWTISATTGTLGLSGTAIYWVDNFNVAVSGVVSASGATLSATSTGSVNRGIMHFCLPASGFDLTYNLGTLNITGGGTGAITLGGYYKSLVIGHPKSLVIGDGSVPFSTSAFFTSLNMTGVAGNLITLTSISPGNPAFLDYYGNNGDIITCDYLSLTDSEIDGYSITDGTTPISITAYAGSHSTNGGDNTNWLFTDPSTGSVATASGTSLASGVGVAQIRSVATSAGSSTVTGIGASKILSVGTIAGQATVTGVGSSLFKSVATSAGSSSVTGVGIDTSRSVGTAAGSATVAGIGQSQSVSVGTITGTSSVSGVGAATTRSIGSSAGQATVAGIGTGAFNSIGTATGAASVTGVGASNFNSVGTSTGSSSVLGIINELFSGAGTAVGTSVASGAGAAITSSIGTVLGTSAVSGVGIAQETSIGTAVGTATVSGISASLFKAIGSAIGIATVTGRSPSYSVGTAIGTAIVTALGNTKPFSPSPNPTEYAESILIPIELAIPIANPTESAINILSPTESPLPIAAFTENPINIKSPVEFFTTP